jgi:hypothetical protein
MSGKKKKNNYLRNGIVIVIVVLLMIFIGSLLGLKSLSGYQIPNNYVYFGVYNYNSTNSTLSFIPSTISLSGAYTGSCQAQNQSYISAPFALESLPINTSFATPASLLPAVSQTNGYTFYWCDIQLPASLLNTTFTEHISATGIYHGQTVYSNGYSTTISLFSNSSSKPLFIFIPTGQTYIGLNLFVNVTN